MAKKSPIDELRKVLDEEVGETAVSLSFRQDSMVATIGADLKTRLMAFSEATRKRYSEVIRDALSEFFKGKDVDGYIREALLRRLEKTGISLEDLQKFKSEHEP